MASRTTTVALLAVGIIGAAAFWVVFSSNSPTYLKDGKTFVFTCYNSDPKGDILGRSNDHGFSAEIAFNGRAYQLPYTGSFLFADYYSDGSINLSLDPEARLDGFPDGPGGLCAI
jgi:hypothetical protein